MARSMIPVIELTDLPPISNVEDWIGTGRKFEDVPEQIREIFRNAIKIPSKYIACLPRDSIPVMEFVQFPLPELVESPLNTPMLGFSKEPSTYENLDVVLQNDLPDPNSFKSMKSVLGQRWLDGYRSITNSDWGDIRLPLSVVTFMEKIYTLTESRHFWQESIYWLREHQKYIEGSNGIAANDNLNLFERVHGALSTLPWNMPVPSHVGFTTNTYSICLSDRWLNDDLIDLALKNLSVRQKNSLSAPKNVLIASHLLGCAVEKALQFRRWDAKYAPLLCKYTSEIKEKPYTDLYTVVNINNNHWISLRVNFVLREISYGDSLDNRVAPPTQLIDAVFAWLDAHFCNTIRGSKKKNRFTNQGNILEHGHQSDLYSCGIAAINSVSHAIFSDPIFNDSQKFYERLRLFEDVAAIYGSKQEEREVRHFGLSCGYVK